MTWKPVQTPKNTGKVAIKFLKKIKELQVKNVFDYKESERLQKLVSKTLKTAKNF